MGITKRKNRNEDSTATIRPVRLVFFFVVTVVVITTPFQCRADAIFLIFNNGAIVKSCKLLII